MCIFARQLISINMRLKLILGFSALFLLTACGPTRYTSST